MKWNKLISELKRRHVFKATIAYLAISWIIIQIASILLPAFNAPDYALKAIIFVLFVGLIIWIAFSWIYDFTADGIQKTDDTETNEETLLLTNRRLNRVIAGSLGLAVVLLVVISFYAGSRWNDKPDLPETRVVAVIPLIQQIEGEGEGEEKEEAYFKEGMTEALISELSKVNDLSVINQASSQVLTSGFDPVNTLITNVINRIDYFVGGEIDRQVNTLNIQIELKESIDSKPVWRKSYTKDISEVRILWAEVAADLSSQMGILVKPSVAMLWSGLRPVKPETYELYIKGKHYLNKSTIEDWQRGLVYLQEAVDQNPADPYAWAGLAEGYISLGHSPAPPPNVFPKALAAAQRAIQLDSTNAAGWAALSDYHTYFGWDWQLAEYAFNRANTLNPNMAWNHYHRAWYLALFGRMNEAIKEHKRAQELDPFTSWHTAWLGELYRLAGQFEKGIMEADRTMEMQDNYALGMLIKGRILIDQGKHEEGLKLLKQASTIMPLWKYWAYGRELIRTGHIQEGKAIIQELEGMEPTDFGALCLGIMYTELGDFDKAFEWFKYKDKPAWYPWIRIYISQEEFQNDPRFLELIREMNLPDPAPLVYDPEL